MTKRQSVLDIMDRIVELQHEIQLHFSKLRNVLADSSLRPEEVSSREISTSSRRRKIKDKDVPTIISSYNDGSSPDKIGRRFGVSGATIRNVLLAEGVKLRGSREAAQCNNQPPTSEAEREESKIIAVFLATKKNYKRTAKKLGARPSEVLYVLRKHQMWDGSKEGHTLRIPEWDYERIAQRVCSGEKIETIARECGVSTATIRNVVRREKTTGKED